MPAKSPPPTEPSASLLQAMGAQIRAHRKTLGVSATAAAEAAGISRVTLHRVEKGEPSVTIGAWSNVLAALGMGLQAKPLSDGVFNRDVIDLAMMALPLRVLRAAMRKAEEAYGNAVARDLAKAIDRLQNRANWLERCMQAMAMEMPKAVLWQKTRALRRVLPPA